MNRDAFIRELRRYGKKTGLVVSYAGGKGKGGHGTVQVGDRFTTVKSGELSNVYVQIVLKQLGLPKDVV